MVLIIKFIISVCVHMSQEEKSKEKIEKVENKTKMLNNLLSNYNSMIKPSNSLD